MSSLVAADTASSVPVEEAFSLADTSVQRPPESDIEQSARNRGEIQVGRENAVPEQGRQAQLVKSVTLLVAMVKKNMFVVSNIIQGGREVEKAWHKLTSYILELERRVREMEAGSGQLLSHQITVRSLSGCR